MVDGTAAAHSPQLFVGRLNVACFIGGAALDQRRFSIPDPVQVEPRQALAHGLAAQARHTPVAAAIDGNVDPLDLASPRPCQAGDVVETFVQQHLTARRRGDDTLALLDAGVLTMRPVRHQVNVMQHFVFGSVGLIAHFEAAQVLDPAHTLHTGHHQPQRVAVLGTQHLAVLTVGDQHFSRADQAHWNGAGHGRAVGAFGQHELALLEVGAHHLQQGDQRNAGEFAARDHPVRILASRHGDVAPFHTGVGAALDEAKA